MRSGSRPWSTATRFSPVAVAGKMMSKEPTIIEIAMDELEEILRRAEAKQFNDKDYETIKTVVQSYVQLLDLLKSKNISIGRLQKMLFGASTEKTATVIGGGTDSEAGPSDGLGRWMTKTPRRTRPDRFGNGPAERFASVRQGPRPQRGRCLSRRREDRGAARVAAAGRRLPGLHAGDGLRGVPPRGAGADHRPGARRGEGLPAPEAALQSLRQGLHGRAARGRGQPEVRRDGREHDRAC